MALNRSLRLFKASVVPIFNSFEKALFLPCNGTMANTSSVAAPKIVPFLKHWRVSVKQFTNLQAPLPG